MVDLSESLRDLRPSLFIGSPAFLSAGLSSYFDFMLPFVSFRLLGFSWVEAAIFSMNILSVLIAFKYKPIKKDLNLEHQALNPKFQFVHNN